MNQTKIIKSYWAEHKCDLRTATEAAFKPATEKYEELTRFVETNHFAIYHHRLLDFGRECQNCGHLFRTPRASFCANCGLTADRNVECGALL